MAATYIGRGSRSTSSRGSHSSGVSKPSQLPGPAEPQTAPAISAMRLSDGNDRYLVLSLIDVDAASKPVVLANLTAGHEQSVREVAGLEQAAVLTGLDGGRIVTVTCWAGQANF